ncbi:MAG: Smr/MutS family protein [Muribaculaceae bacterium]|nr:Smr/MutS family protein [Muribaculaceae bacterium]
MIYPKDFENKIGFSPLRSLLKDKCETSMGKALVDDMNFISNRKFLLKELGSVNEMKGLLESGVSLPDFKCVDIASWLKQRMAPGSFLSVEQLFLSALSFHCMKEIHNFFNNEDSSVSNCKFLKLTFKDIPVFPDLEREIFRCIDKEGNVKDSASPTLYEIRKSIESLSRSMHKIMRRVIDNSINSGIIDKDATPVMREGRMVIPVSSANKRNISGILHDTSSTGKTVFIEPAEVVEAGNKLRELHNEEEQEIIRILIELTGLLLPYYEEIVTACHLLAKYDFIKAKALFAIQIDAQLPVVEEHPEIDWFHALHPGLLLNLRKQGREVVAMNLKLDGDNRILLISGPNAGGKSVALKTVAIVQYMMQCGLLPTLYSNSHMGIFSNIFIDIGDEQSMENDLSTYSSHLTNMKFFLQNANPKTLILADEMGSGTEPTIGAALSQAILEKLGESGCFGIVTTHYQNLKIFVENKDGFVNGAMLYDRQHLRPTFQLSVGEPGSSFALEIARNIGLPSAVIDIAKDLVGSDYVDAERFILDIQRDKRYWRNKRLEIKDKENKLNRLLEEYENKAEELKHQRNNILKEAKQEAKEILQGANVKIERSIHEIRKSQADKEKSKNVRKELEEYKKSLDDDLKSNELPEILKPLKHKSRKKKESASNGNEKINKEGNEKTLVPGDFVKIENGGVVGSIISIEGDKAEVAFGNLRTKIELKKLIPTKKPEEKGKSTSLFTSQSTTNDSSRQRQLNFKNEIDVRGFRADEALQAITYFLDDALQFNASKVRILHGTGHGILRTLIRQQLKSNPNIKDFHDEDVRFGGAGITVVEFI